MTQFTFRLGTLLSLRESQRDACRAELAAARAEQDRLASQRQSLVAEQQRQHDEQRQRASAAAVDLMQLLQLHDYEAALRTSLAQLGELETQQEAIVRQRQIALGEAQREVAVLEKLRERQHQQHQMHESRREQRQLDEIAARRFA